MTDAPTGPLELNQDLAAWGLDNEQSAHDRKTEAASQPDLRALKVGDSFEVVSPIYRLAKVEKVQLLPEPRAIVNCRAHSCLERNAKGKEVLVDAKWSELWGLKTIPTQDYEEDILAIHRINRPLRIGGTDADVPMTTYVAVLNETGRPELHTSQSHLKNTRVMVVPMEGGHASPKSDTAKA